MTWPGGSKRSVASRFPLSRATTFRIGGPAEWAARPSTAAEAAEVLRAAREEGLPVRCVGMGSNLLVSDEGVGGLVLLMRGLSSIRFDGDRVAFGAGVTNAQAVKATRSRALGARVPGRLSGDPRGGGPHERRRRR